MLIKKNISLILKGILMGAADVVPGVSGGTIAFITGIYEELVATIDGLSLNMVKEFFSDGFYQIFKKYNLNFLIALLLGIGISVISLSKLLAFLLVQYPVLVWAFFFGLVSASIIYVGKQITKWSITAILMLILSSALSYVITIIEPVASPDSWWYLILSGFVAIIAMILPGISGAFLLLILGSYEAVLSSISGFIEAIVDGDFTLAWNYLKNILLVALGAVVGIKLFSRALKWLFTNYENLTLALLTGLMIGSLNKLWPWKRVLSTRINSHGKQVPFIEQSILPQNYSGDNLFLYVILFMITGFLLILILERVASKK